MEAELQKLENDILSAIDDDLTRSDLQGVITVAIRKASLLNNKPKPHEKVQERFDELCEQEEFVDWLYENFKDISLNAPLEDLAEFGFGSIGECIHEYDTREN